MINRTDTHPIPKKSPPPPRSPRSLSPLPSIQTSYHSTPQRSPTRSTPHTAAANSDSPTARTTVLLSPQSSYHSKSLQKILSLNGTNLPCIHLHQIIDLPNLRITRFSPRSLQDPSRPPYTDSWYPIRNNARCDPEWPSHLPCPASLSDPSARF